MRNFYISNDRFLKPCYRISPFRTGDIARNACLDYDNSIQRFLENRFSSDTFVFTNSGREALNVALQNYNLDKQDVVTIFTTSGNYYVSSCVTKEIEKICNWSRNIEQRTRIILVIHEFGFPYEDLLQLKSYGLPIIEDSAHCFASQNEEESVGKVGDFVIYSLPKFFPINFGGILFSRAGKMKQVITADKKEYIEKVLSHNIHDFDWIVEKRRYNYQYLSNTLEREFGYKARFALNDKYVPGAFFAKIDDLDLDKLKTFFQDNGVEASIFYGEDAFFMPVNQSLCNVDLDYFVYLIYEFTHSRN